MTTVLRMLCVLVSVIIGLTTAWAENVKPLTQDSFFQALTGKNTHEKQQAASWLASNYSHDTAKPILEAWLNGQLYYLKDRKHAQHQQLFVIESAQTGAEAIQAWNNDPLIIENKRKFKKIKVNNKLRAYLRIEIASLGLNSEDSEVRKQSIKALTGNPEAIGKLSALQQSETNTEIAAMLAFAIAIDKALDPKASNRIDAVESISQSNQAIVLKTLNTILAQETDPQIIAAAERGLQDFQQSQRLYAGVETLFFGLSLGSVLVLAGIGLAITFGVMGVINMAHGELIMLGAYTTYMMQQLLPAHTGVALILSIPMAFVVSGLVGILIERSVIRHLYGRPLETLLATFGISLILQQAVRSIFSPLNRSVSTPDWMAGALEINPMLSLTYNRLYIILFCAMVFLALVMILKKTPLGLQVRAVSQNRPMARAMGIRSERVDALTFGLGAGVAGVAGVALSQLTNVGPNMGQAYIIDSFMVVVFGGVGNLWGTLVAGLGLGLFNKILEPWAGAVLAKILVLVFIILFIQKRPRGLFPQRGRAAES
ncbi:urea ABC transporter permease subunit UrtB [Vibrio europaeus]|uniref:urea ABC transporter permease subunit UrtB n=1 Tax=Vibrio europaeus TaxID=300876 RepID=UPI002340EBC3|nr:urea ABC transporter permease subunit UrtB [Vibrio europaeus]MDC5838786.1 urea ABC transporter permease subunit UrtB [Vibrio europaeus]